MGEPLFPSLLPRAADPLWFNVDRPIDDEAELTKLEEEHNEWLRSIADKGSDIVPIGKKASEQHSDDDDEDDDEDEGEEEDDSDTNDDDELDTDMMDDRDSVDEVEMEGNDPNEDPPAWAM